MKTLNDLKIFCEEKKRIVKINNGKIKGFGAKQ